jgi:hypothetical protein
VRRFHLAAVYEQQLRVASLGTAAARCDVASDALVYRATLIVLATRLTGNIRERRWKRGQGGGEMPANWGWREVRP